MNLGHQPTVSVIVPARDEELNIGRCLQSLISQQNVQIEIIVVDDYSTDRTREVAEGIGGVRIIQARELPEGWTGKANAICSAIPLAKGQWFLFTDADTFHKPGSLARSLSEAQRQGVRFLSYSPEQETSTWWERSIQPLVFAELNSAFDYAQVSDPNSELAAANGQYVLCERNRYEEIGGHSAVRGSLLEDVDLAKLAKRRGNILFRYAPDEVSCRMYHSFAELRDGWSKNLTILFPDLVARAFRIGIEGLGLLVGPLICLLLFVAGFHVYSAVVMLLSTCLFYLFWSRIRAAGYKWTSLISILGIPFFLYFLIRSRWQHRTGKIAWKGRLYKNQIV